jgi:TetR/AcrR family transcriptional regulator, fatty acid metabolism regulator protein
MDFHMSLRKSTCIRKQEIVQAALHAIGEKGVSGLTIAEIAGRAGMSDANIYRHFRGKQEILRALGEFIFAAVMDRAAEIAATKGPALEKLATIFFSHAALIEANPGLPRFVFSEDIHLGDRKLAATIALRMADYIQILSKIITAGIKTGEFRTTLSSRETAVTMIGMIQFTALRWSISHGGFAMESEATELWGNFSRLITRREQQPA